MSINLPTQADLIEKGYVPFESSLSVPIPMHVLLDDDLHRICILWKELLSHTPNHELASLLFVDRTLLFDFVHSIAEEGDLWYTDTVYIHATNYNSYKFVTSSVTMDISKHGISVYGNNIPQVTGYLDEVVDILSTIADICDVDVSPQPVTTGSGEITAGRSRKARVNVGKKKSKAEVKKILKNYLHDDKHFNAMDIKTNIIYASALCQGKTYQSEDVAVMCLSHGTLSIVTPHWELLYTAEELKSKTRTLYTAFSYINEEDVNDLAHVANVLKAVYNLTRGVGNVELV